MVRFTIAVEVPVGPMSDSTKLSHEIVEYLVRPENFAQHLMLTDVKDEGHTTEPSGVPRYHFVGQSDFKWLLKTHKFPVNMSYVQDPTCPTAHWTIRTPLTRYFTRAIRVVEVDRNGRPMLRVVCDVVIEYKRLLASVLAGVRQDIEKQHESLLLAMKTEFETRQSKPNGKQLH